MKRPIHWLVLPLLWLATALRFFRLDAQSFWNDEGNSARLAERSLSLIIEGAAADVHPPLYYLLLAVWRQFLGQSEFALRAFSAFGGLLLVAGVFALGRRLNHTRRPRDKIVHDRSPLSATGGEVGLGIGVALPAAFLAAVHPALIYYSQEARMYALLGLWAVLGTLLLLRLLPLLHRPATRALYACAFGYLFVTVAGLYTHYFFPAVLLVHNLIVAYLLWHKRRPQTAGGRPPATDHTTQTTHHTQHATSLHPFLSRWLSIMLGAFLLYLPWLPVFLRQTSGRGADAVSVSAFLLRAARWLTLGETAPAQGLWSWLAVVAFFSLALLGALAPSRSRQPIAANLKSPISNLQSLTPGLHSLLPPLLMLLLGATRPAYDKFMVIVPPFLALLVVRGALSLWATTAGIAYRSAHVPRVTLRGVRVPRVILRSASMFLIVLILLGCVQSLGNLYFNPAFARADYRGIAARIASEEHPNAGIILNAANQWEVFTYYHRDGAPVYPLPRGQPDAQRIAAELEAITAQHDRLYALFWGEDERDPQRLVERWLDANAFKAREEWVGDVRFVTYAAPPQAVRTMETPAGARFGPHIMLEGYTVRGAQNVGDAADRVELIAGDILQVTLFWQTAQSLDTRYKIFLHLTGDQGLPLAQRDAEPVGNLAPTTTWQPGQTVVDNHGLLLPTDLPPGEYRLTVGLYPLDDPAVRLPVRWTANGGAQTADAYHLATVTVR